MLPAGSQKRAERRLLQFNFETRSQQGGNPNVCEDADGSEYLRTNVPLMVIIDAAMATELTARDTRTTVMRATPRWLLVSRRIAIRNPFRRGARKLPPRLVF